jgi:hypothetical protein
VHEAPGVCGGVARRASGDVRKVRNARRLLDNPTKQLMNPDLIVMRSVMLATLLELLGGRDVAEAWGQHAAEDEASADSRREELPSAIDEKEFEMLMMQAGPQILLFIKTLNP